MPRKVQKLYPNPAIAKSFEAGTVVTLCQMVLMDDLKVSTDAIVPIENYYLNICRSHEDEADKMLREIRKIVRKDIDADSGISFIGAEATESFLAEALSAIIFGITAIEAMANRYISEKYPEKSKAEKFYYLDLHEKLKNTLPRILNKPPLSSTYLWGKFGIYEDLRNRIIHPLPDYFHNYDDWSETLVARLMNKKYGGISSFCEKVFQHFHTEPIHQGNVLHVQRGLQSNPIK